MDPRIAPLSEILRFNTKLFRDCLDGVTDETASARPSASTNSASFIAAHVTNARFFLLKMFGAEQPSPIGADMEGPRSVDDGKRIPGLAETEHAWAIASEAIFDRLDRLTAAELDAPINFPLPVSDPTALSLLAFFVQHDSYHIGQLALLRKHAGLPAIPYL